MYALARGVFRYASRSALHAVVEGNAAHREMWRRSLSLLGPLHDHFSNTRATDEMEQRIRFLVSAQALFAAETIQQVYRQQGREVAYVDVGDSDGSIRILVQGVLTEVPVRSESVNLQQSAVDKIRAKGLSALCMDAMELADSVGGQKFDVVSLFETLEHLPDPVGFLTRIRAITKDKLIISVPLAHRSRVALQYLREPAGDKIWTVENTHIFELHNDDWIRLFRHTGWKVDREWALRVFRPMSWQRVLLQPYWRSVSFEGFWFAQLSKSDEYASRYRIE